MLMDSRLSATPTGYLRKAFTQLVKVAWHFRHVNANLINRTIDHFDWETTLSNLRENDNFSVSFTIPY